MKKEALVDDLDELKEPFTRFFHELIAISFEIYSVLLKALFAVFLLSVQLNSSFNSNLIKL